MTAALDSPLQAAKERLTIAALWAMLRLPGKYGRSCRSPFREDRNPSFSVYDDGRKWKDHATGEGGDAVDFIAMALGISNEHACRKLIELAGVIPQYFHSDFRREEKCSVADRPSDLVELPPLMPYSKELAQRVAQSRGLHIAAVDFASLWMKTIVFAKVCEQDCWILTDASQRCADARRIDARSFPAIGKLGERKSHSLRHSGKSWPVGIYHQDLKSRG